MKKLIFLTLLFFPFLHMSAQELNTFKTSRDSVLLLRNNLLSEKNELLRITDSLKKESLSLTDRITSTNNEILSMLNKAFGKENGGRVFNKQIWKGMTDKMLSCSWGKPDKIDKNIEKWGVFTQWYYGKITFFFKNGKLTDWEEIKN